MSINWDDALNQAEEATRPIPEGPYTFRCVAAKPTKAASSGNPMIRLDLKVEGGPEDGKIAYVNIVFPFDSPRAMKMTFRRLRAAGISEETLRAENPSIEQIAAKLISRQMQGRVSHRLWNGEIQSDVELLGAGGGGSGIPSAPTIPSPVTASAGVPKPPAPTLPPQPPQTQTMPTPAPTPVPPQSVSEDDDEAAF